MKPIEFIKFALVLNGLFVPYYLFMFMLIYFTTRQEMLSILDIWIIFVSLMSGVVNLYIILQLNKRNGI